MARFYAIEPTAPDFWHCDEYYGTEINLNDCYIAAARLPRSNTQTNAYTVGGDGNFGLPWTFTQGNCEIAIEIAGPNPPAAGTQIQLPTNNMRAYINWIIARCVDDDSGIGGFGSYNLEQTIDFINRDYTGRPTDLTQDWPSFITFSIRGPGKPDQPGNYDPTVALVIHGNSQQPSTHAPDYRAAAVESYWYATYASMFRNRNAGNQPSTWWNTALSAASAINEMEYICSPDLGSPTEGDCNALEAKLFGPPSDVVNVGPGTPKVLTSGSCTVDVVAEQSTYLTWGQIAAALGPLLQICLTYGSARVGGVANYQQPQALPADASLPRLAGRGVTPMSQSQTQSQISGLNALPPGVNLTLSRTGRHSL